MARTRIGEARHRPAGCGTSVDADGRTLALFNAAGALYAIDNTCAHWGGPLARVLWTVDRDVPVARLAL